jgi:hypothetical protein
MYIFFGLSAQEIMSEEVELSVCDHDRQATLERANKEATSIEPVVTYVWLIINFFL